jgi:uncharacterized membrane protein YbhN (UPF0104 family)
MFKVILRLVGMVLVLALLNWQVDILNLLTALKHTNYHWLMASGALHVLSLCFSAWRSYHYFRYYGHNVTFMPILRCYLWGNFYNMFILGGIGGDGYRIAMMSKLYGVPLLSGARVIFYERVSGVHILLLFAMLMFYATSFSNIPNLALINTVLLILLTPCYFLITTKLARDQVGIMLRSIPISMLVQALQVMMAIAAFKGVQDAFSMQQSLDMTVLFLWASFAVILPISVGGIGVRELVFASGYNLLHTPEIQQASMASIGSSIFIITLIASLVGAIIMSIAHHLKIS